MLKSEENLVSIKQEFTSRFETLKIIPSNVSPSIRIDKTKPINKPSDLALFIEHTLLKPEATQGDIVKLCEEALRYGFRGVCVNPNFVKVAKTKLKDSGCLTIAVVGFPLGANLTTIKIEETKQAISDGADEIDMVIALGALKEGEYKNVYEDIKAVVEAAKNAAVKVIIETGLLEEREKIAACLLAVRAGAAYVKTSTGFAYVKTSTGYEAKGATEEDVKLMREVVGEGIGIKAAGGIRDYQAACKMVEAGANRLGCSASIEIVKGKEPDTEKGNLGANKNEVAFKYAWDWFSYHASQRLTTFHYFLIVIGIVAAGYLKCMEQGWRWPGVLIGSFGFIISIAFWMLDIRNEELVNCSRNALDKLEGPVGLTIRKDDNNRKFIKQDKEALGLISRLIPSSLLPQIAKHHFWLRFIQGVTALLSLGAAIYSILN